MRVGGRPFSDVLDIRAGDVSERSVTSGRRGAPRVKVADYIVEFLEAQGVTHVYEVSGGMITHLLDALARRARINIVSMHHEQGAAFAAEGHARMTGVPGVSMATSGPGATNLLTGIGSCYFDSIPAVFITGQVNRAEMKGERAIRQLGFQETDIVKMATPITKAAFQAVEPQMVPECLRKAFEIARSGRPGPVLLDVPMDIQRSSISAEEPERVTLPDGHSMAVSAESVEAVLQAVSEAKRPLVLAGGGVRSARAVELFREVVEHLGIPVVVSLMGIDVLGAEHPLRVGFLGSYGNRWSNLAIGRADLLLVLGSRLDVRQTGADTESFVRGKRIIHVDCEAGEINNRVAGSLPVVADLNAFLAAVLDRPPLKLDWSLWFEEIAQLRTAWPDTAELRQVEGVNPNVFMHRLAEASLAAAAFVVDVGQHQMWAAQSLSLHAAQRFLTSGGMGSMGFALPAAIGASMAAAGRPIVVVAGDGGFQNNIQELQTVVRNRLPIKIVILNNQSHGMVRQFQESYFEGRYQSTVKGYSAPDFCEVARAYGISARRLGADPGGAIAPNAIAEALQWLWDSPRAAALLDVKISLAANVYPKIAFGRPITEMEPFAKPLGMEST